MNLTSEQDYLGQIADKADGTHDLAFSNSIGVALRNLKAHYPNASLDETLQAIERFKVEALMLDGLTPEIWDSALGFLLQIVKETKDKFDLITLYLPDNHPEASSPYKAVQYRFLLGDVLALVWSALNDDKAYVHNYEGDETQKLAQAVKDKPIRIRDWLLMVSQFQNNLCHTGIRNDMVLFLNHIHQDVNVIEDAPGAVLSFVKDMLKRAAFENWAEKQMQSDWLKAVVLWMEQSDATELFKLSSDLDTVIVDLKKQLSAHGIYPDARVIKFMNLTLEEFIQSILSNLDFSCDAKAYPELYYLSGLLQANDSKALGALEAKAMRVAVEWIKGGECTLTHPGLERLYLHHMFAQRLRNYEVYLTQIDKQTSTQGLKIKEAMLECDAYFERFILDINTNQAFNKQEMEAVEQAYDIFKQQSMSPTFRTNVASFCN